MFSNRPSQITGLQTGFVCADKYTKNRCLVFVVYVCALLLEGGGEKDTKISL